MTKKAEHAAGRLVIEKCLNSNKWDVMNVELSELICRVDNKANAAHIMKCWNSHDKLLAACKKLIEIAPILGWPQIMDRFEQVVDEAEKS